MAINWEAAAITSNVLTSGNGEYPEFGDIISGNVRIPALDPGEEVIIKIPFNVPCDPKHFCLRACVNTAIDIRFENGHAELIYRDDCAQRNVDVITPILGIPVSSGKIMARNWWDYERVFNLRLAQSPISFYPDERILERMSIDEMLRMEPIFEKANVYLTMDDAMIEAWERGGGRHNEGIERIDRNVFRVFSNDVDFGNLVMAPGEMGYFNFSVEFFEPNPDTEYEFDLILRDAEKTKEIVGIETFSIMKNDGKKDEEYKAKVNGHIKDVYPNPANDHLVIYSSFEDTGIVNNASIRITNISATYSNVYNLDVHNPELHLNIRNFPNGVYVAYLICDGVVIDSYTFMKE